MTAPTQQSDEPLPEMTPSLAQDDAVQFKLAPKPLTEDEARAWLAQPVTAAERPRTISKEEVPSA